MSLKRKASFPTIASPNAGSVSSDQSMMMDASPMHLSSRTRKRFRDDRPEDKVVYENTLRWLFTAQKQQAQTPSMDQDQDMDSEPLPPIEIVDPRQQTLHKFFQPSQPSSQARPNHAHRQSDTSRARSNDIFSQHRSMNIDSPATSIGSDTNSPSSQGVCADMDVDMDCGNDESTKWVGGLGWMS